MNTRLLRALSTAYLLIPSLLFFLYWTRPGIAVVGIGLLIWAYDRHCRADAPMPPEKNLGFEDLLQISLVALLLTIFSGVGGLWEQMFDHWGHNAKLYDLFLHKWPLSYPQGGPAYSYYFGYYLVPALISKVSGSIEEPALFLWTLAGLGLGLAWVYIVLKGKLLYILLCLCFGGFFTLLYIIFCEYEGRTYVIMTPLLEQLRSAPNQIIPTLIVGGMLVHLIKFRGDLQDVVLPCCLALWWALLPALTMGLLVGLLILRQWRSTGIYGPSLFTKIVVPLVVSVPVLTLFASSSGVPDSGFVWELGQRKSFLFNYSVLFVPNLAALYLGWIVLRRGRPATMPAYPFLLTLGLMLLLPLYRMGRYNDLFLRGVMSYTLIAGLYVLIPIAGEGSYRPLLTTARKSVLGFLVVLLMLFSLMGMGKMMKRSVKYNSLTALLFPMRIPYRAFPYDRFPTIYQMQLGQFSQLEARKYLGREDSLYERYIR
jgi:hypothetical protein